MMAEMDWIANVANITGFLPNLRLDELKQNKKFSFTTSNVKKHQTSSTEV